ncbi:UNVERIFIED_CONTAM: hypothetical protein Slati_3403600 [Sesamum latifolium]|uniref:DUF7950 domain-containing protein n=1 Tax=Sesamum latifolium TaxID=2727402 RepID=A0AAW2UGG7_9LAMI
MSFGDDGHVGSWMRHVRLQDPTVAVGRRVVVDSLVTVESVTETWVADCYGWFSLGRTDEEKVMSLHADACPGFVSDGQNRVRWINAAYRRMVGGGGGGGSGGRWWRRRRRWRSCRWAARVSRAG